MARQIAFISVEYLKENTPIQSNVGEKILNQSILEVQELELEPIIGKTAYQRLSNEILSGATISGYTIPEADVEFLQYVKPFMLYATLINSYNQLHYQVSNKGVQKLQDDNSTIADKSDIDALRSSYTAKKDAYKKRLIDYMATDEDDTTGDTDACAASDTTFSFTGIAINDNTYDYGEAYKSYYFKTGYYRRRL